MEQPATWTATVSCGTSASAGASGSEAEVRSADAGAQRAADARAVTAWTTGTAELLSAAIIPRSAAKRYLEQEFGSVQPTLTYFVSQLEFSH